mmetsp:Transcript_18859/g.47298  ORF Transcript_18859/g.47298 Transcript_18859/m.47298 type:complete len:104 (-) Transcript_18859:723-1034(-)
MGVHVSVPCMAPARQIRGEVGCFRNPRPCLMTPMVAPKLAQQHYSNILNAFGAVTADPEEFPARVGFELGPDMLLPPSDWPPEKGSKLLERHLQHPHWWLLQN